MKKVILAVTVGILVAAVGYQLYHSANVKSSQPCWSNLGRIDGAKLQWAGENRAVHGAPVTSENILPYLRVMPTCNVANAKYIIGNILEEPRCTVHGTTSDFKPDRY